MKLGISAIIFVLCLQTCFGQQKAPQFVEVTAQLEVDYWDNAFFFDKVTSEKNESWPGYQGRPTLFPTNQIRRCVVGTNAWMIEYNTKDATTIYWFTGTNFASLSKQSGIQLTDAAPTTNGNPGRPVKVADLMTFDVPGRIYWLALCSGKYLKEADRKVYPPSDFWKESALSKLGWQDHVETFGDELGLPKRIKLTTTNGQTAFQYEAHLAKNAFGWTFPSEFFGVQYRGGGSNGWRVELTFKGKIISIKPATQADVDPANRLSPKPGR